MIWNEQKISLMTDITYSHFTIQKTIIQLFLVIVQFCSVMVICCRMAISLLLTVPAIEHGILDTNAGKQQS